MIPILIIHRIITVIIKPPTIFNFTGLVICKTNNRMKKVYLYDSGFINIDTQ